jgi:HrpA-like RNA helicase
MRSANPFTVLFCQIKTLGVSDVQAFLNMAVEPPKSSAVDASLALLCRLGALESTSNRNLTPLGCVFSAGA